MNREKIEKAAKDYAYKTWAGGGFECASEDSFIAGAEWHINSVWHDANEKPKDEAPFIVEKKILEGEYVYECWVQTPSDNWEGDVIYFDVTRWAYVSDLLPERKEVQP